MVIFFSDQVKTRSSCHRTNFNSAPLLWSKCKKIPLCVVGGHLLGERGSPSFFMGGGLEEVIVRCDWL